MVTVITAQPSAAHLPNLRVIEDYRALHRYIQTPSTAYLATDGHVYAQETPTGFFKFLIRFIQIIERCIYAQKFLGRQSMLLEMLRRAEAILPEALHQTLPADLDSFKRDLEDMENILRSGEFGHIESGFVKDFLALIQDIKKPFPPGEASLSLQDPKKALILQFLTATPADTERMVIEAFQAAESLANPARELYVRFSQIPHAINEILSTGESPSDARLELLARHLYAFNKAIHAPHGFNDRAIVQSLESSLDIAEQFIATSKRLLVESQMILPSLSLKALPSLVEPSAPPLEPVRVEATATSSSAPFEAPLLVRRQIPPIGHEERVNLVIEMFNTLGSEAGLRIIQDKLQFSASVNREEMKNRLLSYAAALGELYLSPGTRFSGHAEIKRLWDEIGLKIAILSGESIV